ncbi:MAG: DUF3108 domain-containing protein [Acidobacteriota bacterium]
MSTMRSAVVVAVVAIVAVSFVIPAGAFALGLRPPKKAGIQSLDPRPASSTGQALRLGDTRGAGVTTPGSQAKKRTKKKQAKPRATSPTAPKPATARPAPAARVEQDVPFKAGETLGYDISWSTAIMTAGTATLSVREKRPSGGSVAYYITAEAQPTPMLAKLYSVYYKVDTLLDAFTLLPQRGSVFSLESGRKRMKILRFNQEAKSAQFEMQTKTVMKKDMVVPAGVQDVLSALFVMRARPLRPGSTISMPVCMNDAVYKMTIAVGGREDVKTGIGTIPAWRLVPVITDAQGKPAGRGMTLWVSDDGRRLPVRMQAELAVGSFNLVLREVR